MNRTLLLQMELCRWHSAYKEAGILSFDVSRRVGTEEGEMLYYPQAGESLKSLAQTGRVFAAGFLLLSLS